MNAEKMKKIALALVVVLVMCGHAFAGQIIYVDDNAVGSNNGSSWADAYNYLQDALADVNSNSDVNEIHVAQGIHKPDLGGGQTLGDRKATFHLINGVTIKGGYAGAGSPDPNARDIELYETILSGDLAGNDVDINDPTDLLNEPTLSENSYHVVTGSPADEAILLDETAVLDGLTITGGNANGPVFPGGYCYGGGMFTDSELDLDLIGQRASPTIIDCTFIKNSAISAGGGIYAEFSQIKLINCDFISNTVNGEYTARGGGMFCDGQVLLIDCTFNKNLSIDIENAGEGGGLYYRGGKAAITRCTFNENSAGWYGGGIYNGGSPTLIDCAFISNNSKWGGGVCSYDNSSPSLTNCTFIGNSAGSGGGVCNFQNNPTVLKCMFIGNLTSWSGGGMYNQKGNPILKHCVFNANSSCYGGGMMNSECDPVVTGCVFSGNMAVYYGGAIFNYASIREWSGNTVKLINCTLNGNWATNGSAMACDTNCFIYKKQGNVYTTNCILWDIGNEIWNDIHWDITINYSDVQGGWPGQGNINVDPGFIDPENNDYHLLPDSPCVNAGDNSAVPPSLLTDLDGDPRIIDVIVDMGAYEFQGIHILYVDADAPAGGDGGSWATAYNYLQDALFNAIPPAEIRVAQGIYKPHLNTYSTAPPSRADTFQLKNGVVIKGGYAGIGAPDFAPVDPNERDIEMFRTILSGDLDGNDIDVNDAWDIWREPSFVDNSYHVVTASGTNSAAILDGFIITGGCASGPMSYDSNDIFLSSGAGMYNDSGSPTVINCTFRKNTTWTWYGQIDGESGFDDGNPSLESTDIYLPETSGAAVFNRDGSPTFRNCLFEDNVAFGPDASCAGAGVCNINSNPLLTNCVFKANVTTGFDSEYFGGAMANYNSNPTLLDCSFIDNRADYSCGGAIYNDESSLSLTGCTFRGNRADDFGGGMYNSRSESELRECEFIENVAAFAGGGMYNYDSNSRVTNCNFAENFAANGGAICISGDFSGTFTDCVFENNTAASEGGAILHKGFGGESNIIRCEFRNGSAERGGAIYNIYESLILSECILVCNQAEYAGAAIYTDGDITLTNCLLANNHAQVLGGALANAMNTSKSINCTFVGNSASYGGAISSGIECDTTTINSIFWDNTAQTGSQIATTGAHYSSRLTVSYCDIENGLEGLDVPDGCTLIWGEGNIDAIPCFVDPDGADNVFGTEDDNLRLSYGSPCIDTGDPDYVAEPNETDIDGNPRVIGGRIDMGAYEFWGPIYVDDDSPNDPGPGDPQVSDPLENGTEAHPFDTIQEAVDLAVDGYTVLVRQGSYSEPGNSNCIDFLSKNITLTSEDPTDWDIVDNTIVRGYVQFSGTEGPNCKFTGFRISSIEGAIYGGNHTHATISHCNISGNGPCGATVIRDCDGTISNCLITDNTTFSYCGVYPVVFGCNGLIKNCTITNNISGVSVGTATIENCIIYNNYGSQLGVGSSETLNISYCNLQGGLEGITGEGSVNRGPGNIDTNPCFIRLGYWIMDEMTLIEGDYHLRSEGWRWNTEGKSWTYDYATSRCVDAGNPASDLGDELMSVPRDPDNTWGINLRINMGAFGGTGQASMPPHGWALPADLNNDGIVNYLDFAYQAQDWQATAPEQPGDQNRDGVVNKIDLAALAKSWLQVTVWGEW
ncbi:MAG: right-handed parallel beta-helix repeat-containing protein [Phycisphaerae bacterium]|nr:right-handed parallel beta-helix repeat-containing protein [Phycisphaerae bacterium]